MGRLFQYNRFGATDNINKRNKKDTQTKNKMLRNAIKCPAYSDIYGQYNDSSFEKCQQWSNKLQFPTAVAAAAAVTVPAEEPSQSRTHKVYDSMKNFLQRKLFAQPSHKERTLNEDPTSDYDEDLLDSSYQADAEEEEEERDADCSCSSNSNSNTSSISSSSHADTPKRSPQKSLLSLNCWQSSQPSDSNKEEDDSDAGISDCCQLLVENTSSKKQRRSSPKKRTSLPRYNSSNSTEDDDDDEEPELLACAWYQPRISAKAAQEHLQQSTPGSFLLRRSTPRHFELCLRLERKVKTYPVQSTRTQMYRLKGAKKQFSTLKALITHHSVMAEQLPLTLDMPRERHVVKPSAVRYADDFEPLESLQLLGILKSLQAKSIEI
ncbi:uncharacterized protein LOC108152920 isoform X2 [Drosophila miranda]|uniref:uncharacterized protein LOC108152920 isoform X2 n=1 Tax=Drosophila miranda TaxID=7229 RepID=UPI0007E89715|nr:uncharacterized protein LOC108152920 isoform X2 [Drosophila miranda]